MRSMCWSAVRSDVRRGVAVCCGGHVVVVATAADKQLLNIRVVGGAVGTTAVGVWWGEGCEGGTGRT